jgi:hypothetical protein
VRKCFINIAFQHCFEYAIRKVQKHQEGLELNGACQLLFYADDCNLSDENIRITRENTETILHAVKEVSLEMNAEKIKQNSGQKYNKR